MTLTKAELAQHLIDGIGLTIREAKQMVEAFFEEISATLEAGKEVKLSGFGVFTLRDNLERPGRNPKTGEEIPICARRVVTFHASEKLKMAGLGASRGSSRNEFVLPKSDWCMSPQIPLHGKSINLQSDKRRTVQSGSCSSPAVRNTHIK